jgi:ribonuclease R
LVEAAPVAGALRFELLSEGRVTPRGRKREENSRAQVKAHPGRSPRKKNRRPAKGKPGKSKKGKS